MGSGDLAATCLVSAYRTVDFKFPITTYRELSAFIVQLRAKRQVVTDGPIGCPHEEGIDYPEGKPCPQCPYWAGRDRFTRERIQ